MNSVLAVFLVLPAILVASPTEMKKDEMMMMGADHNMYDLMHHDDKSSFAMFITAIDTAGVKDVFTGTGAKHTCFAPSDAAFGKMNADDRKALFGDKAKLSKFVHNHVITKELAAKDMVDGMKLTTMDSQEVSVSVHGSEVHLTLPNGHMAKVTRPDIKANNGYVHMVDTVMW